jgi:hypothetical protein
MPARLLPRSIRSCSSLPLQSLIPNSYLPILPRMRFVPLRRLPAIVMLLPSIHPEGSGDANSPSLPILTMRTGNHHNSVGDLFQPPTPLGFALRSFSLKRRSASPFELPILPCSWQKQMSRRVTHLHCLCFEGFLPSLSRCNTSAIKLLVPTRTPLGF